ncbi:hypothetical protein RND71_030023 [Anisodus tanguticus]|uniref:Uncharacterized protein n=1 Tax=Anisodus tanguticus TaxID=243964 RepID=A0AAE1V7S6_9SOLA|nr:hypothetical protein RND71_030023 [Anisodus tanguticus]
MKGGVLHAPHHCLVTATLDTMLFFFVKKIHVTPIASSSLYTIESTMKPPPLPKHHHFPPVTDKL